MRKKASLILLGCIVMLLAGLYVFSRNAQQGMPPENYLYTLSGENDMTLEEISSNSKLDCMVFNDCSVVDDVIIKDGENNSIIITHPSVEVNKTQQGMYDVVSRMLTEYVYLARYIERNYEGCKDGAISIIFEYEVNGLQVKYKNSTDDFEHYYSEGSDYEIFNHFLSNTYYFRDGDKAECDSFDRALNGESN